MVDRNRDVLAREQEEAAAQEAAAIGGRVPGQDEVDPAQRAPSEAGEGVAEGFELAEQDLIEHASHGNLESARPAYHHRDDRYEEGEPQAGEADEILSSELADREPRQDWER